MGCFDKNSNRCGDKVFASCVKYEGTVSNDSSLVDVDCKTIEDTTKDLYELHTVIKEEIDVTELANECITFSTPRTVKSVIQEMINKICDLEALIEAQNDTIATMQSQIEDLQTNTCP